ncbi:sporulation initiation factor Spo0A C-terminal domain-containing protein [Acutalibacter sp. 1XD8-36]|uniref:sporulation initiation factor Spo0A C-terminal domain-containing protein n=1 Tax=Acutalibacter sp. 1XD8-36 TaxID=2320852 RepID=UPI001FAE23B3|nr:sporulation initiation factor Spo0A C-terminal domain-containing protein [Acutalibacter sp. 1XD8-36]
MPTVDPQKVGDLSEEEKQMIAAHRLKTNFPTKAPDKITNSIEGALKQFSIKKTYKGYPFLVNAIREAVIDLPERLTTLEICERVSANKKADPAVVGRELTRMVSNIWRFTENPTVYSRIVKHEVVEKPMPVEFIYALADYLTRQKC